MLPATVKGDLRMSKSVGGAILAAKLDELSNKESERAEV